MNQEFLAAELKKAEELALTLTKDHEWPYRSLVSAITKEGISSYCATMALFKLMSDGGPLKFTPDRLVQTYVVERPRCFMCGQILDGRNHTWCV